MKVGARFYNPEIGRWIQKDPILSGINWWVYCENDQVNYVDPTGEIFDPGEWVVVIVKGIVKYRSFVYPLVGIGVATFAVWLWIEHGLEKASKSSETPRREWREGVGQVAGAPPWNAGLYHPKKEGSQYRIYIEILPNLSGDF